MSGDTCTACAENCESCVVKGASRCDENKCKEAFGLKPEFVCDGESSITLLRTLLNNGNGSEFAGRECSRVGHTNRRPRAEMDLGRFYPWIGLDWVGLG